MPGENGRILIAGAGPVGLALALGLARRGVASIVIEKNPALSEHSKALLVSTRTLEILHEWDLLETFKASSEWLDEVRPVDVTTGRELLHVDLSGLRSISAGYGVCILPQDETERLLYEACQATGLVEVRFGHSVNSFDSDDSGVRVRIQSSEGQYVVEAPFLCGCDGAHSTVREGLGFELEGITYDAHAILADVKIEDERDQLPWPRGNLRSSGFAFAIRFKTGSWRLVVAQRGSTDEGRPEGKEIQKWVDVLIGPGPFEDIWSSAFKLHRRNAPHFRVGRTLLLGDAAHINSPAGGQGMNAGIQDAHNLAWKLAVPMRGGDVEALLKSYDEERFDAMTHNVDVATDRLTRVGILAPAWIRRGAIALAGRLSRNRAMTRRMAIGAGMLNLRYDQSALIDASGGRYLPDIQLGDGLRLRSALGKNGGLLEIVQGGSKVALSDATYDLSQEASTEIARVGGPILAIRPDHVIAYSGGSREKAEAYHSCWQGLASR